MGAYAERNGRVAPAGGGPGAGRTGLRAAVRPLRVLALVIAAVLAVLAAGSGRAAEEGLALAPGDTVSYAVIGVPELSTVSTIGMDGRLQLPLVGWVEAAGLTIEGLRREVAAQAGSTPVRTVGADGQEVWRQISPDLLFLTVAAYRPVYLIGDVRENGEQPFRPGLTLRQAIARAGGFGAALELPDSGTQLISLSAERDVLAGEAAFVKATLARLEADLAAIGSGGAEGSEAAEAAAAAAAAHDDGAARWLDARNAERQLSRGNSELVARQMKNRLEVLEELLRTHQANLKIEQDALERAQSLADRGLTPASNVTEARRAVLDVSMQALETSGEIHRLQLDLARSSDEVARLQYSQRAELLGEIVSSTASLRTLERRLAALDQRLMALGGQHLVSQIKPAYRIMIHRPGSGGIETGELSDIPLLPGDVLEVRAIPAEEAEAVPTQ
ncbi:polysaccharide biosynthesis/export family protein [Cribrihabitans neustonicus]|uniref:polysaccharide biosynthesis/export family protein n=1 Tax=Cribrihabitans neustonicus TaxID=1429085 RepID=UPI003B5A949A